MSHNSVGDSAETTRKPLRSVAFCLPFFEKLVMSFQLLSVIYNGIFENTELFLFMMTVYGHRYRTWFMVMI